MQDAVDVSRDREGGFEHALRPKGVSRFKRLNDKVIFLDARRMTVKRDAGVPRRNVLDVKGNHLTK